MSEYQTVFASLKDYTKGSLEIVNDNPKHYVFSNVFDVATKSKPYEKVAVAVNVEYVIEAIRAEGVSTWFAAAHDEVVVVMALLDPVDRLAAIIGTHVIDSTVAIHIHRQMRIVIKSSPNHLHIAEEVLLPVRCLVPRTTADDIELAIVVDIDRRTGCVLRRRVDRMCTKERQFRASAP